MTSSNEVFVDTSAFKALVDSSDDFHEQATKLWTHLHEQEAALVTSNYILDEVFTLIRVRSGLAIALKCRDFIAESSTSLQIVRVTIEDEAAAWQWFEHQWTGLSYTDCVSFSQMKRLGITRAASFDKHFKRAGFDLVR